MTIVYPTVLSTHMSLRLYNRIPSELFSLPSLQVLHLKGNLLSGTLPDIIPGSLSWVDISGNFVEGTIPSTYNSLKDLRLGGNHIYGPIPDSLCNNKVVNEGRTRTHGCDAILCKLGYYSDGGFASSSGCTPCPKGQSTRYLGSDSCTTFTQKDLLQMFFDVTNGDNWETRYSKGWKSDDECEFEGVMCDEDGLVVGLSFPVSGLPGAMNS